MTWQATTLGKLSVLGPEYGANAPAVSATGSLPRYVRITDLDDQGGLRTTDPAEAKLEDFKQFILEEGDLLLARSGATVGKSYLYTESDGPCIFAGYLIRFRLDRQLVIPRYVLYYTQSPRYRQWVASKKRIAAQPNINGTEYASLTLPLPTLSEQERIVEVLDQANAIRKKRAEADVKAERILPVLFYKMFGDPTANQLNWEVTTLARAGADVRYGLGQPPALSSIGIPMVRATNIHHGTITDLDMIRVDPGEVPKDRNAFLAGEEVLVVRSGAYTGDVAQVTEKWAGSVAGYDLIVSPGPKLCGEYIESYLLTPHVQKNHFGRLRARAGQPHINAAQLLETPILLPPRPLQLAFAGMVKAVRGLSRNLETATSMLDKLFRALLYRAFSGDLTATWREAHMKELLVEMEQQSRLLAESGVID